MTEVVVVVDAVVDVVVVTNNAVEMLRDANINGFVEVLANEFTGVVTVFKVVTTDLFEACRC